jgi:catechol 2,3-dioxygenase-like lactoylglutathione lyase family enzyme/uncharacterized protein (DUF1330 family)
MRTDTEKLLSSGLHAALGGDYVNGPRSIASFEGPAPVNHATLIVRFPCLANAHAFWYSPVYQETIRPLRLDPSAGDFTVRVYPEVDPPHATAQSAPPFRRATLVVADLDRALKLYRDVLGFTASAPRPIARDGSAAAIFNLRRGEQARFLTLDAGERQGEIVGLIEVPSFRPAQGGVRATAMVIKVPVALGSIVPRLKAAGATLMPPTMAGLNKEQGLLDADGNLIVLYELAR